MCKSGRAIYTENSGDKDNAVKKMLVNIPKTICNVLIIAVVSQSITIILIAVLMFLKENALEYNFLQEVFVGDMLTIGLSIIAIAVSVWIGLNIYVTISKEELAQIEEKLNAAALQKEELIKTVTETQKHLEKFLNMEKQQFQRLLKIQGYKYALSSYLASMLEENILLNDAVLLFELIDAEEQNQFVTEYYEKSKWYETVKCAENTKKLYEKILQYIHENVTYEMVESKDYMDMNLYISSRISDLIFYQNAGCLRVKDLRNDFSIIEMNESINIYIDFWDRKEKDISSCFNGNDVLAYIKNTIGYSYDLINQYDANEERKSQAKTYLEEAVKLVDSKSKKARYLRNYGLALERLGDIETARKQYAMAITEDASDSKSYNNYAATVIKALEKKEHIFRRMAVLDKLDIPYQEWKIELFKAVNMCKQCINMDPIFEDAYIKLIQAYTYLYLATDSKKLQREAKRYIDCLDVRDNKSNGFLFAKRNYYEAVKDYEKAYDVNSQIKPTANNDVEHMERLYKKELVGLEKE